MTMSCVSAKAMEGSRSGDGWMNVQRGNVYRKMSDLMRITFSGEDKFEVLGLQSAEPNRAEPLTKRLAVSEPVRLLGDNDGESEHPNYLLS
jgi:hypothetical protein